MNKNRRSIAPGIAFGYLSSAPGVETAQPQQQLVPLVDAAGIADHAVVDAAAENIANAYLPRR